MREKGAVGPLHPRELVHWDEHVLTVFWSSPVASPPFGLCGPLEYLGCQFGCPQAIREHDTEPQLPPRPHLVEFFNFAQPDHRCRVPVVRTMSPLDFHYNLSRFVYVVESVTTRRGA